jgi:diguanylate cyclase (GGDEF)-like protein/PAS domain S-box-containing protein
MAAMLAIYWLLLLSVALKLRRNTSESFRLRFENLDLIADLREQRRREQELNNELSHEIEERTHMERELRRSEAKFRGLTENSPVAVFIIQNGRFAYANKAVSKLTGHSEDELRGMALADVLHPEDAPRVLERIEKRLASGGEEDPVEIRVVRKDGRVVWVQTVGKVVEHGDTPATLGTAVDVTASKEAEDRLRHMATTDVLTGLANRRHFMDIFKREFSRARRYGRQLCLLVIDADHFKAINDTHGHDAGDKALQKLAKLARDNLRDVDLLGRLGGEEFTALLPDTSGEEGIMAAERLRALAESTDIDIGGKAIRVTLSVGVGCLRESDATPDELMKRVDDSLYEAKKRGRNRVMPSS